MNDNECIRESIKVLNEFYNGTEKDQLFAQYQLVKYYLVGYGAIPKDPVKARRLLRQYIYRTKFEDGNAVMDYVDMLLKNGGDEAEKEAYDIALSLSLLGNVDFIRKVSVMQREGKGIDPSLDSAIETLTTAISDHSELSPDLAFLLIKRGQEIDYEKIPQLVENNEDSLSLYCMAIYYSKGPNKDLDLAIDYMRSSANLGLGWASNEVVDLLIQRGSADDLEEAFKRASDLFEQKDAAGTRRLSIMYYSGIGIEPDKEKSIIIMRNAISFGDKVAKEKLINMLIEENSLDSLKEALRLCESINPRKRNALENRINQGIQELRESV